MSDKLLQASQKKYRAVWGLIATGGIPEPYCETAPGSWPVLSDGISSTQDITKIPIEMQAVRASIVNGTGINQTGIAEAAADMKKFQDPANVISQVIGWILDFVASIISAVLAIVTSIAGSIFSEVVGNIINITTLPRAVNIGWMVVRDICNMFFILALIVIGFGVILRLKNYQEYGHLLRDLIIAALLVNFSQVIAVTIMNAVNFLAAVFYQDGMGKQIASTAFAQAWPAEDFRLIVTGGSSTALVLSLGKIFYQLVSAVVFIALAGMFIIRLVGLYILIIFSPIAYVANILPATKKYAEEWWSHFLKYLIWAPVALFMIRLDTLVISDGFSWTGWKNGQGNGTAFIYFIEIAFLAAAVLVAKQAGMVGGDMIMSGVSGAKNLMKKGAWAGVKAGANYGAEVYKARTGREIRPAKWIEGWKESREINRAARETAGMTKAYEKGSALASPVTFFQRYFGKGGIKKARGGGSETGRELLHDAEELKTKANAPLELRKQAQQALEEARQLEREKAALPAIDVNGKAAKDLAITDKRVKAQALLDQADEAEKAFGTESREQILARARATELKGQSLMYPDDYFTQKKIRHAMDEEKKNILTDNWHELVDLFNSAVEEGKQARANAILMHLTDTYNDNELVNKTQYTRDMIGADGKQHKAGEFMTYSAEGMDDFRKQILEEKLGMGEQGSMLIMSDVSDLAEKRGHRTIMRMYESKHGRLEMKSAQDRKNEQAAENAKLDDSKLTREGNRLIFYDEVPAADYGVSGKRDSIINEVGLTYYMTNYQAIKNRVNRNEMNANQAMNAAKPQNVKRIFEAANLIQDPKVQKEYRETMSALIDFGRTKLADASGDSKLDAAFKHFSGSGAPAPDTRPEDMSWRPSGYIPDEKDSAGKEKRAYIHAK